MTKIYSRRQKDKGKGEYVSTKVLKAFIKMQRADVVCLQETKLKEVSKEDD